jgi:anthranilate phosphoribosyltransferase
MRIETPAEGAEIIRAILAGEKGPRRDVVLANAGTAVYVAGLAKTPAECVARAAEAIDSGAARRTLEALVACSHASG